MSTEPITLTSEPVISLVGHGATHEQLDGVRRELYSKIDRLDSKMDKSHQLLNAKIDTNLKWRVGMWLTILASIIGLAFHG